MKPRPYLSIATLSALATGFALPVTSLLVLAKGFTYSELSLGIALYSATVLLLELPSGVLADRFGRRTLFLLSQALHILVAALLLTAGTLPLLYAAQILHGAARALSSGSFDALTIDRTIEAKGPASLPTITKWLQIADGAGLALGSLAAGGLMQLSTTLFGASRLYLLPLGARILTLLLTAVLTLAFVRPDAPLIKPKPASAGVPRTKAAIPRTLLPLMASMLTFGLILSALETYGTPYLSTLLSESQTWLLGMLSFAAFAATILGNLLGGRALARLGPRRLFFLSRAALAACALLLSFQQSPLPMIAAYTLSYLLMGMGSLSESVWLGHETPAGRRATFMSIQSLLIQCGCLLSSALAGILLTRLDIPWLWRIVALVLLAVLGLSAAFSAKRIPSRVQDPHAS